MIYHHPDLVRSKYLDIVVANDKLNCEIQLTIFFTSGALMQSIVPILFSTCSYAPLGAEIGRLGGLSTGGFQDQEFPDGERYYRLATEVYGRDVALLGGTISDRDTLELYDKAWALVESGARSLTLVLPYFGYQTMERSVHAGEVVMAKSRAHLLSHLPSADCGNRIIFLDLHSEGIPYYFDAGIRTYHLYAKPLIIQAARRLGGNDFVLASTDAGRAKWVESLAGDMHVDASFVYKRRLDGKRTEITGISAQVKDKIVVIYDDMIRTGGSLMQAASAYRQAGAAAVYAIATHGVFPDDSLQKIRDSKILEGLVCTDSHPRAITLANDFLKIETIASLITERLVDKQ